MRRLFSYKQYKASGLCTPLMATLDYQVAAPHPSIPMAPASMPQ